MSKNSKARVKENNAFDVFFSQKKLGFEFISEKGNYEVLINRETSNIKVQLPSGELIDRHSEDYFSEDLLEDEEFDLWLKSLIMSIEFFGSDLWQP